MNKYKALVEAIDAAVAAAHASGLPHIAGQLYTVRDVRDELSLTRLEDRIVTISRLLTLRKVSPSSRFSTAAFKLAQALKDARYL